MDYTHIIILNWNGGEDTWRCVHSVCMLPDVRIYIVDNASSDESIDFIRRQLSETGLHYTELADDEVVKLTRLDDKISIIHSTQNLGFAKGINLILQPLLKRDDVGYIWLLNNDAIAAHDALSHLLQAMNNDPSLAFAGSMIMDGRRHEEVQCFGVKYYPWLGVGKMLFKGSSASSIGPEETAAKPADFQHGASLLMRMDAIRKIGLLDERFFLYSEEHDWQERAKKAGLGNIRIEKSKVFHLGSMSTARSKHLFYYYYCRSSVLFSKKHNRGIIPIVATVMLIAITAIRTRLHPRSMRWALKGIHEAWQTNM